MRIIAAGMARSGSTWLYRLMQLMTGLPGHGDTPTLRHDSGVWKTHMYSWALEEQCNFSITCFRDIRWACVSAMRMNGRASDKPIHWCLDQMAWHHQWSKADSCIGNFQYEHTHRCLETELDVIDLIDWGMGLGLKSDQKKEIQKNVRRGRVRYATRRTLEDLSIRELEVVRAIEAYPALADWIESHGYEKELVE